MPYFHSEYTAQPVVFLSFLEPKSVQLPRRCLLPSSEAGKTTLGRGVAQLLGLDFEDLDEVWK